MSWQGIKELHYHLGIWRYLSPQNKLSKMDCEVLFDKLNSENQKLKFNEPILRRQGATDKFSAAAHSQLLVFHVSIAQTCAHSSMQELLVEQEGCHTRSPLVAWDLICRPKRGKQGQVSLDASSEMKFLQQNMFDMCYASFIQSGWNVIREFLNQNKESVKLS